MPAQNFRESRFPAPYFHLLGHIFLAVEACEHNSSLASALEKAGFGKDAIAKGHKLVATGQELVDRKAEEVFDDRIYEHNVHKSADEVEMWKSTVSFLLKKALDDDALVKKTLGEGLHGDSHTVTVIAQALRIIAMIRTEPRIREKLGDGRKTRDLIIRGWTLLNKVFRNGQILVRPSSAGDPDAQLFDEIAAHADEMMRWVIALGQATAKMKADPGLFGELGYVPEGKGMPLGGTSYGVPLHQRAQRDELPDAHDLRPDPGWSAGRQGRNRENMGAGGWVEPSFE